MTNNTIPNVSRELLERLRSYIPNGDGYNSQYANDLADAAEEIERLSAPSPADVYGLEVGDVECNCSWNPDSHANTCPVYLRDRLSDAQAIIDGLRDQLHVAHEKIGRYADQRDQQAQRIGELEGLLRESYEEGEYFMEEGLLDRIDAALSAGKEGE